jgi:hypothetical protein
MINWERMGERGGHCIFSQWRADSPFIARKVNRETMVWPKRR